MAKKGITNKNSKKTISHRGFTGGIYEACAHFGIATTLYYRRRAKGWTLEQALDIPSGDPLPGEDAHGTPWKYSSEKAFIAKLGRERMSGETDRPPLHRRFLLERYLAALDHGRSFEGFKVKAIRKHVKAALQDEITNSY